MKTIQNTPLKRGGFSYVGLTLMLTCLSLAGLFSVMAVSVNANGSAASAAPLPARTKNIEDIKTGDLVWAFDPAQGTWRIEPVIKPLVHDYVGDMVTISVAGQTIESTGNHPYWVASGAGLCDRPQAHDVRESDRESAISGGKGRWIAARNLQPGDELVLKDGQSEPISGVQVSYANQRVYNLEVADLHTYGVTELGVVVHNKCFVAGTLILMGDGSVKAIDQVVLGDQVLAKDVNERGPPTTHRVVALIRNWTEHLVHVRAIGGGELQATRMHPFWVPSRGWTNAVDLRPGDALQDDRGHDVIVSKVQVEDRTCNTYNLTIEGVHTYYVLAGTDPVLVHNQTVPTVTTGQKTWQTYTKTNPDTGQVYSGRTSGTGTSQQNVTNRDNGHHMTDQGYGPAVLDKSSSNSDAIRGREQQKIDQNGGAQSAGGTSGNAIRGVSPTNPNASKYNDAADQEFGPCP